eukprot:375719-Rhodomonas_salina.2
MSFVSVSICSPIQLTTPVCLSLMCCVFLWRYANSDVQCTVGHASFACVCKASSCVSRFILPLRCPVSAVLRNWRRSLERNRACDASRGVALSVRVSPRGGRLVLTEVRCVAGRRSPSSPTPRLVCACARVCVL